MIEEIEIYRAAHQLVKRYGEDAEFEAAMGADAMIKREWNHGRIRAPASCGSIRGWASIDLRAH